MSQGRTAPAETTKDALTYGRALPYGQAVPRTQMGCACPGSFGQHVAVSPPPLKKVAQSAHGHEVQEVAGMYGLHTPAVQISSWAHSLPHVPQWVFSF